MDKFYETGTDSKGFNYIKCLVCGLTSYHPEDINHLYCGHCHEFHQFRGLTKSNRCDIIELGEKENNVDSYVKMTLIAWLFCLIVLVISICLQLK